MRIYDYEGHHIVIASEQQGQGVTAHATVSRRLPGGGCEVKCVPLKQHFPTATEAVLMLAAAIERRIANETFWNSLGGSEAPSEGSNRQGAAGTR